MTDASAERDSSTPRYDFEEIDLASDSVHADVVRLVGEGKRVLELGPATGYMTRVLRERGCTVVGIEVDPAMAEQAERFCERIVVGDLDVLDLDEALGEERFDVVVAADVLEHLKDPLAALRKLRRFLAEDGFFVISIPNVAHGSVRLALLTGHFEYRDVGLLDSTHLRFFTRESFERTIDEAELGLAELHRHELNLDASEVPFDLDAVPRELRELLESDPDSRTYQFVAKAIPMEREGLREIQSRLREVAELRVAAARAEELESQMAEIAGREGELRRALIEAHDQLLRRDARLDEMHEELVARDAEIVKREAEIERVHADLHQAQLALDAIWRSPGGIAYRALRALLGGRLRRRRAAKAGGGPSQND
jgi:2-polyprenyl-3-methyl-5-hydroxy-6-metoxy-1,4-benzoquinol methylase